MISKKKIMALITVIAIAALAFTACGGGGATGPVNVDKLNADYPDGEVSLTGYVIDRYSAFLGVDYPTKKIDVFKNPELYPSAVLDLSRNQYTDPATGKQSNGGSEWGIMVALSDGTYSFLKFSGLTDDLGASRTNELFLYVPGAAANTKVTVTGTKIPASKVDYSAAVNIYPEWPEITVKTMEIPAE